MDARRSETRPAAPRTGGAREACLPRFDAAKPIAFEGMPGGSKADASGGPNPGRLPVPAAAGAAPR